MLSIVTVLYGGEDVLKSTLETWREFAGAECEFVVVDHSPNCLDASLGLSRWATYVWDPGNPGFAAGANRAIGLSTGDPIVLLNPDIYLSSSALVEFARAPRDRLGAVGLKTDGVVHRGIEYTWWGFCRDGKSAGLSVLGPSGGGAVIPRSVLPALEPLPEHLFAWGEDAEWALLNFLNGVSTVVLPIVLEHVGGHSVSDLAGQRFKARLLARNRVLTFRRLFGGRLKVAVGPFFALALALNGLRKVRSRTAKAYAVGVREGLTSPLRHLPDKRVGLRAWLEIAMLPSESGVRIWLLSYLRRRRAVSLDSDLR